MSSAVPYSASLGGPITDDSIKAATAQFSEGIIGNAFDVSRPPWTYAAPDFKASIGASPKKNLPLAGLVDFLKGVRSESPKTLSRVTSSHVVVFTKTGIAECYETLEMHNAVGSPSVIRHYMSKAVWRRQDHGYWLIAEYSTVQGSQGLGDPAATFTSGNLTPSPETHHTTIIVDTLKAMTAQFSLAINSRLFDISRPPWSYIKQDVFTATMPPAEHEKKTLVEMVQLLETICKHSPTARSTIIDSSAVVRENIGWAEVWQNLELRDTARSKDVVHHFMERMIWERQDGDGDGDGDGRWLAVEYRNIRGLDRTGLPR